MTAEPQTITDQLAETLVREFKHPKSPCRVRLAGLASIAEKLVENGATPYGATEILKRKFNSTLHNTTVARHLNKECDCE